MAPTAIEERHLAFPHLWWIVWVLPSRFSNWPRVWLSPSALDFADSTAHVCRLRDINTCAPGNFSDQFCMTLSLLLDLRVDLKHGLELPEDLSEGFSVVFHEFHGLAVERI